jgi:hypothetical protein
MTSRRSTARRPMFKTERDLVHCFIAQLHSWTGLKPVGGEPQVSSEFDYARGRTDVVALTNDGDIVAFEAKLTKWRSALQQAYRNTCFSDRSYVVLPMNIAKRAAEFELDFAVRHIGLCGVSEGRLLVIREAPRCEPTQPWLTRRAIEHIRACGVHAVAA